MLWYYSSKGFSFDSMTEFGSGVYNVGDGNDFDTTDSSFIVFEKTGITKYVIQGDNTLTETAILSKSSGYNIEYKNIDRFGDELFVKQNNNVVYFAAKDASNKRNLFKITDGGAPVPLLTGSDENNYIFMDVSFSDDGRFVANAQQMSTGKYGILEGNFQSATYTFAEKAGFTQIVDVLIE
jgi:hypothetical protein